MRKALLPKTEGLLSIQFQIGGSSEVCSGAAARAGASAFARLNRRTQLARTLQKMASFAAFALLELPFSPFYFERMNCLSTRTWSPLGSASAMDSPRGESKQLLRSIDGPLGPTATKAPEVRLKRWR